MVIFLYGNDTYRSRERLRELVARFKNERDPSGMNIAWCDAERTDAEIISAALSATPFFAKRRMVVVENLFSVGVSVDVGEVVSQFVYHEGDSAENVLIVWEGAGSEKPRRKRTASATRPMKGKVSAKRSTGEWRITLREKLKKGKYAEEYASLEGTALDAWVRKEVRRRGASIHSAAVHELVTLVGEDLWRMKGEIDKLVHRSANGTITEDAVREMVLGVMDTDIFALLDAMARKDRARALELLRSSFNEGMPPQRLLSMMLWQFKNVVLAKSGTGASSLAPFVLSKARAIAKNFTDQQIHSLYDALLSLDHSLKHASTGINPELFFDLFVLRISVPFSQNAHPS